MRIVFFIESLRSGGKERRLTELLKLLSQRQEVQIKLVLLKEDIHYEVVGDLDIDIEIIPRRYLKKDPTVFYRFYKLVKKFKPNLIHVWGNMPAVYAIPAKVLSKTPMVNNQISDAPLKVSNSLLEHRLTFKFSDKIVANSKAGLAAYDVGSEKGAVVYNGFDFKRIEGVVSPDVIRKKFNISTKYCVGMVASFSDKKDYTTYIRAANKILDTNDEVSFLCIGSGDDQKYRALVDDKHRNRIFFLGKQNQVEQIMNMCDIGVLATITEGLPNAVLEFMALGKPVIATDGGGTKELVADGRNGYLVDLRDENHLAEKLEIVLNDQELRERFGKNSKNIVADKFSLIKMTDQFMKIYQDINKNNVR